MLASFAPPFWRVLLKDELFEEGNSPLRDLMETPGDMVLCLLNSFQRALILNAFLVHGLIEV